MLWADPVAAEKGMTEEPYRSEEALVEGLKAGEQLAQLILVKRWSSSSRYEAMKWSRSAKGAIAPASDSPLCSSTARSRACSWLILLRARFASRH